LRSASVCRNRGAVTSVAERLRSRRRSTRCRFDAARKHWTILRAGCSVPRVCPEEDRPSQSG
jgi:hypothetical protein